jgi:uncharacterized protein (DUF58 family)
VKGASEGIVRFVPPRKGRRHALRVIREVLAPVRSAEGQGPGDPDLRGLLDRVRRVEIAAQRLVNEQLSGRYHSVFKGRGMSFDEVRPYTPGDEVRLIDWNVSARTGDVFIKHFVEERELTVLILADVSASMDFGLSAAEVNTPRGTRHVEDTKHDLAAQIAAAVALSAQINNDRVGLVTFRGDVAAALSFVGRVMKRRAAVFVVSDFEAGDFEGVLRVATRRHDVHAFVVRDPVEERLFAGGIVPLRDAETGRIAWVRTDRAFLERFRRATEERATAVDQVFKRLRVPFTRFATDRDFNRPLAGHFARLKGKAL